jgi:hypothetical protein
VRKQGQRTCSSLLRRGRGHRRRRRLHTPPLLYPTHPRFPDRSASSKTVPSTVFHHPCTRRKASCLHTNTARPSTDPGNCTASCASCTRSANHPPCTHGSHQPGRCRSACRMPADRSSCTCKISSRDGSSRVPTSTPRTAFGAPGMLPRYSGCLSSYQFYSRLAGCR